MLINENKIWIALKIIKTEGKCLVYRLILKRMTSIIFW